MIRTKTYRTGDTIGATTVVDVRRRNRSQFVTVERQDGEHRLFSDELRAALIDESTVEVLGHVDFSLPLEIIRPGWLVATGHEGGVLVKRSPLVRDDTRMFAPVREWIEAHGLVSSSHEVVVDDGWMCGEYASELYGVPNRCGAQVSALVGAE